MKLTEQEQEIYLANVISIACADRATSPKRLSNLDAIRSELGAKKSAFNQALKRFEQSSDDLTPLGILVADISALFDGMSVALANSLQLDRRKISRFSDAIGLSGEQLERLEEQAIHKSQRFMSGGMCSICNAVLPSGSKFCLACGAPVVAESVNKIPLDFDIPKSGWSIEFAESNSAAFPRALKSAQKADTFQNCKRAGKVWYLGTWSETRFAEVCEAAEQLSGLRNKRCYRGGEELDWDNVFGFLWCMSARQKAFKPNAYCFGMSNERPNPWGCVRVNMEWTDWARWFSYGSFAQAGFMKKGHIWTFDKSKIAHEMESNLHSVKFCPHLNRAFIDAVLRALPEQIHLPNNENWTYKESYEDVPGSIKIVEIEKSGDFDFKREYQAVGVVPKGYEVLRKIVMNARNSIGISDMFDPFS